MYRTFRQLLVAAVLILSACSENQLSPDRTAPIFAPSIPLASAVTLPAECATEARAQSAIDSLLPQLFGPGGGRRGKAQGYSNAVEKSRRNGHQALAETNVDSLVNFTLTTYYANNLIGGQSTATQTRVLKFIYLLYCSNNITPIPDLSGIFGAANTVLIRNGTPTTLVSDPLDSAAVKVDQGDVPGIVGGQPFFGTFVSVYKTTTPLPTSLDWYGIDGYKAGAFEFVSNPAVTFTNPVLTGVCISYDDAIVTSPGDLRLAHAVAAGYAPVVPGNYVLTTSGGTIEIGAPVSTAPLSLACPPLPFAARSVFGRFLQQFAILVLPDRLYAAVTGGSTGGQVVKFSPFAAVDTRLNSSSTGPASPQYIPVGGSQTTATVSVTVTTRNGATPIDGIPVTFAPGGSFSPASATTGNDGTASSAWTIVDGTNTGTGTPVQAPLTFDPLAADFSVTAFQVTNLSITAPASPLTDGVQGAAYPSTTFSASGGIGTFAWAVTSGSLPAGLTLSGAGVLSGTPTALGSASFTVQVTSGPSTITQDYTLNIRPPAVVITTTSLPGGQATLAYGPTTLTATGGDLSYTWTLAAGSSLPAGLALSAGGVLNGTPSVYGSFDLTVRATSGPAGNQVYGEQAFTLDILPPPVVITTTTLPGGQATLAYGPTTLTATGGTGSYTWTVVAGSLPAGVALSTGGDLDGTPSAYGSFPFTVRATSGPAGNQVFVQKAFTLAILPPPVDISTTSLANGQATVPYGPTTLTATGGTGSYTWTVVAGSLPAGVGLSTAGVLSGTPTAYNTFNFTVRATSGPAGNQVFDEQALALTILPPPVLITTASPLPNATVGVPYSQTLQATGGIGSYSWTLTGGSLPAGLTFSGAGVLSGAATAPGTSNFTVQAVSGAVNATRTYALTAAYPTALSLVFQPGPSGSQCYALNAVMTPNIAVKVTDQGGNPLSGVPVNIVAVTNNGAKVVPSQPFAISGANGLAVFNTLSINKNGGYRLVVSTQSPWPVKSLQSGKFTISPSCP